MPFKKWLAGGTVIDPPTTSVDFVGATATKSGDTTTLTFQTGDITSVTAGSGLSGGGSSGAVTLTVDTAVTATLAAEQTFATGAKKFTTLLLQVLHASNGFVTKFATAATADRTVTFPDATFTVAQAAAATGTPSATAAPAFTGTAPVAAANLATPVFTGTGQASAGQVITTTDNQTMTLNQCAGMWFVSAEHGPYLIASNTAVTGAPAVLTIYGTAPTTDAGTYKILTGMTPVGTVAAVPTAAHTHTQS